ncbi:MAG: hypothetical protein CYG60_14880 [Actinobacteria bacterium]|nr:hypothetical protein [Actinomycetota bacterium]PLS84974.1 MAG: hypothetical protein CYG60_14880 [Actinomycetota bacterium]
MQILVNHLTRMQPGYVCVAGVDVNTLRHVRPVLRYGRLTTALLRPNGGPLDIGSVVDLGPTEDASRPPELEDRYFDPAKAAWLFDDEPDDYWDLLDETSRESLGEIFGPALELWDESCTVEVGEGRASLGCLKPEKQPWLYVDHRGTVRMILDHLTPSADLAVNDLRLYESDGKTPRRNLVADVQRRLEADVETILSVGLTRPWRKRGDTAERHWLQINNIHLKDNPLWRLGDEREQVASSTSHPPYHS